jgi:hypothetical protein
MPKEQLTVGDLRGTHILYRANAPEWFFLMASYEGAKELVRLGYLRQNERESDTNYARRKSEAYGFSYSKSVVDLFNFYLFKKPVKRDMATLKGDELWTAFMKDCNLYGDDFDNFLTEQGRYASIEGHMGILVDKASVTFENRKEQLEQGVYPYVASYFPTAILDWEYKRDDNNRPYLAYLKLLDDSDEDVVQYRLWWTDHFEVWEIPLETDDQKIKDDSDALMVLEGDNPIGEIPFVWLQNLRSKKRPIGMSDIHDVARIDVSILSNLSEGEEVITYAAFPMMRKPMKESHPDGAQVPAKEDHAAVTAILEFDPNHPESKPDWLEAKVAEPIDAILGWIARKVQEIYRAVNAGGMASTEISTEAKSGAALKAEFQLLNANLVRKATNLEKAEEQIIEYWLRWEEQDYKNIIADISIERSRTYDVENLASDLENALTAQTIVKSKKFNEAIQKSVARAMLPAADDDQIKEIDEEIEASPATPPITPGAAFGTEVGAPEEEEEEEEV